MNENRQPARDVKDYKNLTRSVAQNHARTEIKKNKEHTSGNMLDQFMHKKWVLWVIHYVKSRFGKRHPFNTYENSNDKGIYQLTSVNNAGSVKIALLADWGTDTEES